MLTWNKIHALEIQSLLQLLFLPILYFFAVIRPWDQCIVAVFGQERQGLGSLFVRPSAQWSYQGLQNLSHSRRKPGRTNFIVQLPVLLGVPARFPQYYSLASRYYFLRCRQLSLWQTWSKPGFASFSNESYQWLATKTSLHYRLYHRAQRRLSHSRTRTDRIQVSESFPRTCFANPLLNLRLLPPQLLSLQSILVLNFHCF